MTRSVLFVLLLVVAVAMVALAARIYFTRWSTYLPPNARRAAFAVEACGLLAFAGGLVMEAFGLRDHNPDLGFVGSIVVIGAIAFGYGSRYSVRHTN